MGWEDIQSIATLVATVVVAGATVHYAKTTKRLLSEAVQDREARAKVDDERRQADRERQARNVSGTLRLGADYAPQRTIDGYPKGVSSVYADLVNASALPVRGLVAIVHSREGDFTTSEGVPVLATGNQTVSFDVPTSKNTDLVLELEFDDDTGVRWHRLGEPSLWEVKPHDDND